MADLKVSTDVVVSTAEEINGLNNQIRDGFADVETAMKQLDNQWDSSVATKAMEEFNKMRYSFTDARYKVLENYTNFLLQQIGEGYTQTEDKNKSWADAFK